MSSSLGSHRWQVSAGRLVCLYCLRTAVTISEYNSADCTLPERERLLLESIDPAPPPLSFFDICIEAIEGAPRISERRETPPRKKEPIFPRNAERKENAKDPAPPQHPPEDPSRSDHKWRLRCTLCSHTFTRKWTSPEQFWRCNNIDYGSPQCRGIVRVVPKQTHHEMALPPSSTPIPITLHDEDIWLNPRGGSKIDSLYGSITVPVEAFSVNFLDSKDRWYEESTEPYRSVASLNWPHGRIRTSGRERWREGLPRRRHYYGSLEY